MKKGIAVLTILIAFGSSAFALPTSSHDGMGVKIVEWSPQLLAEI